jgi:hypothetical protein
MGPFFSPLKEDVVFRICLLARILLIWEKPKHRETVVKICCVSTLNTLRFALLYDHEQNFSDVGRSL